MGYGDDYTDRLADYVDVATRIAEFREKYPEGSLRPADLARPYTIERVTGWENTGDQRNPQWVEVTRTFLVYVAAAHRHPDDKAPGIGAAWEPYPGRTPYTRDSELQNAETSAWGRAIVAVLAADMKAGVSTREEVRNRQDERQQPPPDERQQAYAQLRALVQAKGIPEERVPPEFASRIGVQIQDATAAQVQDFIGLVERGEIA